MSVEQEKVEPQSSRAPQAELPMGSTVREHQAPCLYRLNHRPHGTHGVEVWSHSTKKTSFCLSPLSSPQLWLTGTLSPGQAGWFLVNRAANSLSHHWRPLQEFWNSRGSGDFCCFSWEHPCCWGRRERQERGKAVRMVMLQTD